MMPHRRTARPAARIALLGMLLALALALSFFESVLPALPMLPPGVKLGLSNIVTMYCLFFLNAKSAFAVALLKSGFVLMMRGPIGAAMSFSGGFCSVVLMLLLIRLLPQLSGQVVSIAGAVAHNLGQMVMAGIVLNSAYTFFYLPIMVLSGILMGLLTGILLRLTLPYLQKLPHAPDV